MANTVAFQERDAKINSDIEAAVAAALSTGKPVLPAPGSELCNLYVQKLQRSYDVSRAKEDTDNAIDLLYIAYNTTPQERGGVRTKISGIMNDLIMVQNRSKTVMEKGMATAEFVMKYATESYFPDWLDVRNCTDPKNEECVGDLKDFLKTDLIKMGKKVQEQAEILKKELDAIAKYYDEIITKLKSTTDDAEIALADELNNKAKLKEEMNQNNAKRAALESMLKDLQAQVDKYEKMAKDYESRAQTAEERAFIMSIVQVGAQVISSAMPAVVTAATAAATGGTSLIASSAASTIQRVVGDKNPEPTSEQQSATDTSKDEESIKIQKDIKDKKVELDTAEKKVQDLEDSEKAIKSDIETKQKGEGKETDSSVEVSSDDSDSVKALKQRLADVVKNLAEAKDNYSKLLGAVQSLQDSLSALDKGLGKMSQQQQDAASSLRALQMQMLDKLEVYEKEKRTQNAELVRINALLVGQRTREEILQLTIQSLNASISALKRTKEIIVEIYFFFKSFSDYMVNVGTEAGIDVEMFERFVDKEKVRNNFLKSLIQNGDKFFVRVVAQWDAVHSVSSKFAACFEEGSSKLNALDGDYKTGDVLKEYLTTVAPKIEKIVQARKAAADQKILDLDKFRADTKKMAVGE